MLTARVIPCLDVDGGRVVKGIRFQGLRDAGDPAERAAAYQADGADELTMLDVSATPQGRGNAHHTVAALRRALSIPLTVGGGVRRLDDAARLLEAGADKVAVNTAAQRRPQLVAEIAERFGSQCAVVAIDAARRRQGAGWEVVVHSGRERTGQDAIAWAREVEARGAGEILLTSWDRDGTRSGYDTALIAAVAAAVGLPIVASGGAAVPGHLVAAIRAGAAAVLAASIFHDGDYGLGCVKAAMARAGIPVRPAG